MSTTVKLWLLDLRKPARRMRYAELPLLVCGRAAWAVLPNGGRKLLGASAFFTEASARRAQVGAIHLRLKNHFANRRYPRETAFYARRLEELRSGLGPDRKRTETRRDAEAP